MSFSVLNGVPARLKPKLWGFGAPKSTRLVFSMCIAAPPTPAFFALFPSQQLLLPGTSCSTSVDAVVAAPCETALPFIPNFTAPPIQAALYLKEAAPEMEMLLLPIAHMAPP
jgi:hypothetical protein